MMTMKKPIITKILNPTIISTSPNIMIPIGIPHANKIKSIRYDKTKHAWVDKYTGSDIIYVQGEGWINTANGLKVVYKKE